MIPLILLIESSFANGSEQPVGELAFLNTPHPVNRPNKLLYTRRLPSIFAGLSDVDFGKYGREDQDHF